MSRQGNGDGSVYQRKDGLWIGAAYVTTTAGTRKRIYVSGKARADVRSRLNERVRAEARGMLSPARHWTFGEYLDYYMETVASTKVRRTTFVRYQYIANKYLRPALASADLQRMTVARVQSMMNGHLEAGASARTLHHARAVLRAVLSQAEREEQVARNVAKLVQLPTYERQLIEPWEPDEVIRFLDTARRHPWYGAFLLLLAYGMRRGEVLGLTWEHVHLERGILQVAAQLQRIDSHLQLTPVKTAAGNRSLPVIGELHSVLTHAAKEQGGRPSGFVFTSNRGTPIDPKNFVRAFHQIREEAGLRRITVHHTRHTAATALKNLGVPARDAQMILGHADITTTQQIYQHSDLAAKREALDRVARSLKQVRVAEVAAEVAPSSEGQGAKLPALTSGTPERIRTSDTWFRSFVQASGVDTLTPVVRHLQTRSRALILGRVAALTAAPAARTHRAFEQPLDDRELLRHLDRALSSERIRGLSFPYSLLPRA